MKFKSISVILLLISSVFGADEGNLTPEENDERLEKCGTDKTDFQPPWMFYISYSDSLKTIGSYISRRHALTTSMLVLNRNMTWRHDGSSIDCDYKGLGPDLEVPTVLVQALLVANFTEVPIDRVTKAFLPEICSKKIQDHFSKEFSPMILELKSNSPKILYPCLADGSEDVGKKNDVKEYTHIRGHLEGGRTVQIHDSPIHPHKFFSFDPIRNTEKGGFIAANFNNRTTLLGIKTLSYQQNVLSLNYFYKLDSLYTSLCWRVKICRGKIGSGVTVPSETSTEPVVTSAELWSTEASETSEAPKPRETATSLELTSLGPNTSPGASTVLPPAPVHRRTMPPEYVDHGDYDMIFDSLYEFPEFREIEETPYEKKGCRKSFELVLVVFIVFLV